MLAASAPSTKTKAKPETKTVKAVKAFLDRRLPFNDIPALIERALDRLEQGPLTSIEQCVGVDADTRRRVQEWVDTRAGGA